MKAIGFFRTAADGAKEGLPDLVEQEKAFFSFCEQQGFEPAATFVEREADGSGEEYQRLLEYVQRPDRGFMVLVVQRPEHLGADIPVSMRRLLHLAHLGVQVVTADVAEDRPLARLLAAWSARQGKGTNGRRIQEAMKAKAMKGEALGRPPFGYRIGGSRRLELLPQEAATVELIYHLNADNGFGLRRIAGYLNERGLKTKAGGNWSVVGVRDVLRNRVYTGTYSRFGIQIPGSHPAIVPYKLFARVQEKLKRPETRQTRSFTPYLLSGLLYCGRCGKRMMGVKRHPKWRRSDGSEGQAEYRYYQCQSRNNQSICQYNSQVAGELEAEVAERLAEYAREHQGANLSQVQTPSEGERQRLEAQLQDLEQRFQDLMDKACAGDISHNDLQALAWKLTDEERPLQEKIRSLSQETVEREHAAQERTTLLQELLNSEERWPHMELAERKSLLERAISRITVTDDGVDITWLSDAG